MHNLKVLILGPPLFISTLNELKAFLKFNPLSSNSKNYDMILFHEDALKEEQKKNLIQKSESIKIFASKDRKILQNYDAVLELPANLKEINSIVENIAARKKFNLIKIPR